MAAVPTRAATGPQGCFGQNGVDDSFIPGLVTSERVAVVRPIFTATPYSLYEYGSFYAFYARHVGDHGNITTDLNLLSTNVSSGQGFEGAGYQYSVSTKGYNQGWGASYGLYTFVTSPSARACGLRVGSNVHVIDDARVSAGGLAYSNGSARFDVVVVPFSEYVTPGEYQSYKTFVQGGGTLVLLGAHSLEWFVDYNATSGMETLSYGHGFAFNGRSAWRTRCSTDDFAACPWAKDYAGWIGSVPTGTTGIRFRGARVNDSQLIGKPLSREFGDVVFGSYKAHEENRLANSTGTSVIATFSNRSNVMIASYVHHFGRGRVVCMCVFGDDIVGSDLSAQYFLVLAIASPLLGPRLACSAPTDAPPDMCTATVNGWSPTGTVTWSSSAKVSIAPRSCRLSGGRCSVSVSDLPLGTFSLRATYNGDCRNAPSLATAYIDTSGLAQSFPGSNFDSPNAGLLGRTSGAAEPGAAATTGPDGAVARASNPALLVAFTVTTLAVLGSVLVVSRRFRER